MNAERLLQHYERIADAPDAIARLRRFILDLAVRGKLVPQDPNDEPASELLKRIAKEKVRLVKAGEIRTPKAIAVQSEAPFPIPSNWRWSQLAEIGVLSPRNEAPDTLEASFVPMPMIAAEYGVANQHEVRSWGEIRKGYTHFAEGDVGLAKITPCFENGKSAVFRNLTGGIGAGTTELHIVRPLFVEQDFILLFLKSPHFIETGIPKMTGTAGQKRVPTEYFAHSPFPLPPLAEQHRIVAKVDELMGLCDRLEAARAGREAVRDRLAAASLARLNAPDAETFQADARFALDALPGLTTRPDQIKRLRQTILNLAVRGKLVPQDPNDEPASELLKRIAKEKARLVKAGEFRKPKALPEVEEPPFDLPQNWRWTPIREVTSDRGQEIPQSTFTYIDVTAIDKEAGVVADPKVLEASEAPSRARKITRKGDVIYSCVRPYLLNVAVIETDFDPPPIASTAFAILNGHGLVMPRFIWIVLRSPFMVACVEENQRGQAYPAINDADFAVLPFPLPPLAEQHRLVAKVDELMGLCDRLEASLNAAAATRRRLLEALLAEAFAPVDARELEATE
ncbi:MAG: restriction endonuclease subunit S [Hyphomicrobiales bacterium]|nr:restriction endonuclease subunit S [Hyphomicrobiales bacterium]